MWAEDNPINQLVAGELLQHVGLQVSIAGTGREAVSEASSQDFDLILMDMQMPDMDGLEATRMIRQLPLHGRTPIVAMTANAFLEDQRACFDAGMNDHLSKPVAPQTLYATVLRLLTEAS